MKPIRLAPAVTAYTWEAEFTETGYAVLARVFPESAKIAKDRAYAMVRKQLVHENIARRCNIGTGVRFTIDYERSAVYLEDERPEVALTTPKYFHELYEMQTGKKVINVTLVVTHGCNLRCTYCYETNKGNRIMTAETARVFADSLFASWDTHGEFVNPDNAHALILDFIGGEPLLEVELIDTFMEYFLREAVERNHPWATNYMISMTSNGTLYDTEKVQHFCAKYDGRLSLTVTVDGNKELHDACRVFPDGTGSYDLASAALNKLIQRSKGAHVGTKITLAPENITHASKSIIAMLERPGIQLVHANCVFEEGWTPDHAKIFYAELRVLADWLMSRPSKACTPFSETIGNALPTDDNQNWCGGNFQMRCIDVDGKTYPCMRFAPLSLPPDVEPYCIGDVEHGLGHTQEQRDRIEVLKGITRHSQSTDECFDCPIASGCAWCTAYNYQVFGTPDKRATFICPMHKARVLANVYYWNTRYRAEGSAERFPMNVPRAWAIEIISEDEYEMLVQLATPNGGDSRV